MARKQPDKARTAAPTIIKGRYVGRAPKMGRPRKGGDIRAARGVRLNPELLKRVDEVINVRKAANVTTFTGAVERALTYWLTDVEAGLPGAVRGFGAAPAFEERVRR